MQKDKSLSIREWIALAVAEHVLHATGALFLFLQSVVDELGHGDVPEGTVSLGIGHFAGHKAFANLDFTALEVDVLPFQTVNFTGTHAGEKSNCEIPAEVFPDTSYK